MVEFFTNNLTTISLVALIGLIVLIDWYFRKKKKGISQEIDIVKDSGKKSTKPSKRFLIFSALFIFLSGFGFYEFYISPNQIIEEIKLNNESATRLSVMSRDQVETDIRLWSVNPLKNG